MKEQFELIKLDNEPYDFLVIATSSISPLSCLGDIVDEIGEKTASVLFDLTLINGTNRNRYIKGEYVNGSFVTSSFSIVNTLDEGVGNICKTFFAENDSIVQNSVVSKQLKFLIKQGMV